MWVGKFALSPEGLPAGGVAWVDLGTTAASSPAVVNGAAYHPTYQSLDGVSALYVTTEAVASSDTYIGGFRYRSDGALRVYDATSAVPAGANTNQGIALTSDGQLCYTTGNTTAFALNGVAVDTERRVYAAPLAFELQFADAGAGVVDTTEEITGAEATFTRATTATTVLSSGLIVSVASGVARSYYDPETLEYLGYLAEGARTNLGLSSEDLRSAAAGNPVTNWTNTDTTVTVAGTTAPDGALTGNLLVEGSAGTAAVFDDYTATADTTQSGSRWVKRGNTDWVRLTIQEAAGATNGVSAWFNLATEATAVANNGTGTGAVATMKRYPNGWYRCTISGAVNNAATALRMLSCSSSAASVTTRVANSERFEWGAQIENNAAFASSYIPTTTAAVTRNADVLTYPTTGWLNAAAGTLYTSGEVRSIAANMAFASINDGTSNEMILNRINSSTGAMVFLVTDGGVTQTGISSGTISVDETASIAGAYEANNFAVSANGGTVGTDTSGTLPTVTTVNVGIGAGQQLYGTVRRVAYYAARLANATLQGLTS